MNKTTSLSKTESLSEKALIDFREKYEGLIEAKWSEIKNLILELNINRPGTSLYDHHFKIWNEKYNFEAVRANKGLSLTFTRLVGLSRELLKLDFYLKNIDKLYLKCCVIHPECLEKEIEAKWEIKRNRIIDGKIYNMILTPSFDLKANILMIFGLVLEHDYYGIKFKLTDKSIAKVLGIKYLPTVRDNINKLKEHGLIDITYIHSQRLITTFTPKTFDVILDKLLGEDRIIDRLPVIDFLINYREMSPSEYLIYTYILKNKLYRYFHPEKQFYNLTEEYFQDKLDDLVDKEMIFLKISNNPPVITYQIEKNKLREIRNSKF